MLQIRNELMSAFANAQHKQWEDTLVEHLTRCCPEVVCEIEDSQLRERIRECEAKGAKYGITAAGCVASFTQILFEEGFEFDVQPSDPWVQEILQDPSRDQYTKVDHLWAFLDGYDKEDIEQASLDRETPELPEEQHEDILSIDADFENE